MKITTVEAAREAMLTMLSDNDAATVQRWVQAVHNCREVHIDDAGDIHIANPQVGHWLGDDKLIETVNRINAGELAEALKKMVKQFDDEIHSEYDGTGHLTRRLAEADHARAALAKAGIEVPNE